MLDAIAFMLSTRQAAQRAQSARPRSRQSALSARPARPRGQRRRLRSGG